MCCLKALPFQICPLPSAFDDGENPTKRHQHTNCNVRWLLAAWLERKNGFGQQVAACQSAHSRHSEYAACIPQCCLRFSDTPGFLRSVGWPRSSQGCHPILLRAMKSWRASDSAPAHESHAARCERFLVSVDHCPPGLSAGSRHG